jgi:hypothetical protein
MIVEEAQLPGYVYYYLLDYARYRSDIGTVLPILLDFNQMRAKIP